MKSYIVDKHYKDSTANVGMNSPSVAQPGWYECFMKPNSANIVAAYKKRYNSLVTIRSDLIARFEKRPTEKYQFLLLENQRIICRWCKDNFIDKYTIDIFEIIKGRYTSSLRNSPAILTNNEVDATAFVLRWT